MIPPTDSIRKIIVVTEDVLGPMRNSLYIELNDGSYVSLDEVKEMRRFVAGLEKDHPRLAAAVMEALSIVGDMCGERVFDVEAL